MRGHVQICQHLLILGHNLNQEGAVVAGFVPVIPVMNAGLVAIDFFGKPLAVKREIEAGIGVGEGPVVSPAKAILVGEHEGREVVLAAKSALEGLDWRFMAKLVEVADDNQIGSRFLFKDTVNVFAGEPGFVEAHESLIGFGNFALRLQMESDVAEVILWIDRESDVENAALKGEFEIANGVGVVVPTVAIDDGIL